MFFVKKGEEILFNIKDDKVSCGEGGGVEEEPEHLYIHEIASGEEVLFLVAGDHDLSRFIFFIYLIVFIFCDFIVFEIEVFVMEIESFLNELFHAHVALQKSATVVV